MKLRLTRIAAALLTLALCAGTASAQGENAVKLTSYPAAKESAVVRIIVDAHKCTDYDAKQRLKKLPAYISSAAGTTTTANANEILKKLVALGAKAELATVQVSIVSVESSQDSGRPHDEAVRYPSPSAQEQKAAKAAGWEKGFGTAATTAQAEYEKAAAEKSSELGYPSALVDDFLSGVAAGRLDKAEVNGYKAGYAAFAELKNGGRSKNKVSKKVGTTTLAKENGYTDAAEIERFKKGAERAQKDVSAGKKQVSPKFGNPYK